LTNLRLNVILEGSVSCRNLLLCGRLSDIPALYAQNSRAMVGLLLFLIGSASSTWSREPSTIIYRGCTTSMWPRRRAIGFADVRFFVWGGHAGLDGSFSGWKQPSGYAVTP
jgi:hypothetical protein